MPLIYVLLLAVGLIRLLAFLPFIRSGVIGGLANLLAYVGLHWVASLQVYMTDYMRSSAMRQRFERELAHFMDDPDCQRVVVIAHSMGTVIAYEGLATASASATAGDSRDSTTAEGDDKPITFICLGQALRRMWLVERSDAHRLRRALPPSVDRWVNFWARYDPVPAGPLGPRALAQLGPWPDPDAPDPSPEIVATLKGCKNRAVTNADSLFTDHTTYWRNLEQVVGPIAHELVVGHQALEATVQEVLDLQASSDAVLVRRWDVAWRNLVALGAGAIAALSLLYLNVDLGLNLGGKVYGFLGSSSFFRLVVGTVTGGFCSVGGDGSIVCGGVNAGLNQWLQAIETSSSPTLDPLSTLLRLITAVAISVVTPPFVDYLLTAAVVLASATICMLGVGRLFAVPAPFAFSPMPRMRQGSKAIAWALWFVGVACLAFYNLLLNGGAVVFFYFAGSALSVVSWFAALGITIRGRRWGWAIGMVVGAFLLSAGCYVLFIGLGATPPTSVPIQLPDRIPGAVALGPFVTTAVYLVFGPSAPRVPRSRVHATE
jgi:hypothetical protein